MTKTDPLATDERCQACKGTGCDLSYAATCDICLGTGSRSKEPQSTSPALPTDEMIEAASEAVYDFLDARFPDGAMPGGQQLFATDHLDAEFKHEAGCTELAKAALKAALAMQAKAPATSPGMREALIEEARRAYIAGATDVHIYWKGMTGTEQPEPDFAEAASDYAEHRAALSQSSSPVEVGRLREALERIAADFEDFPLPEHVKLGDAAWRSMAVEQQSIARQALSLQTKDNEEDVERVARAIANELDAIDDRVSKGNCFWEPALFREISSKQIARAAISALSGGNKPLDIAD